LRIPRLYLGQPLQPGAELELEAERSHYLTRVLRLKEQAPLRVFDGQGMEVNAHIKTLSKRSCCLQLEDNVSNHSQSPLQVELAIGLSRGERFDFVVQKATELGVSNITPLFTERTEVKLNAERTNKRHQHWQKIAISACEQSGRHTLPTIATPLAFHDWLPQVSSEQRLILDPFATPASLEQSAPVGSCTLLVGPEGGFANSEVEQAVQAGFTALQLGPRVLRTETAPIAALTLVQYLWGDLASLG